MDKSPDAFRTISEVAEHLDTPAHVLRFWESRFPQIKPVKRAGGRRYYRPADVALLSGIKKLLHDEGLTIRGVQKFLREQGVKHVSDMSDFDLVESPEAEIALDVEADAGPDPAVSTDPIPLFPKPKPETPVADNAITEDADTPEIAANPLPDEPEAEAPQAPEAVPEAGMASLPDTPEESPAKIDAPEAEPIAAGSDVLADEVAEDDGIDEAALMAALSDPVENTSPEVDEDAALMEALQTTEPRSEPEEPRAEAADGADDAPQFPFDSPPVPPASGQEGADDSALEAQNQPESVETVATEGEPEVAKAAEPKTPLPAPMPPVTEISGHWLPADLRALPRGALGNKRAEASALATRLEALRNRVRDLGRVPRR